MTNEFEAAFPPGTQVKIDALEEQLRLARADRDYWHEVAWKAMHELDEIGTIQSRARSGIYNALTREPSWQERMARRVQG